MAQTDNGSGVTYVELLLDILPLLIIAFCLLIIRGIAFIKQSYLQRNFIGTLCNVLFSSAAMAAFSVGIVLCLPLAGVTLTPHMELGLTVFLSAGGMKIFDAILRKRFGLHVVDLREGEFIETLSKLTSTDTASKGDGDVNNQKTVGT